jgi:hypothetical protein
MLREHHTPVIVLRMPKKVNSFLGLGTLEIDFLVDARQV